MRDGVEVVLEGIDGCGKNTQLTMLFDWFCEQLGEERVAETKEPWPDDNTEAVIRDFLRKDQDDIIFSPAALQRLYVWNRLAHRERLVDPLLDDGRVVLVDRSFPSTLAYGYAAAEERWDCWRERIVQYHRGIFSGATCPWRMPDIVVVLGLNPHEAVRRASNRGNPDRFDDDVAFTRRVQEGYRLFTVDVGWRVSPFNTIDVVWVDATPEPDVVFDCLRTKLIPHLHARGLEVCS